MSNRLKKGDSIPYAQISNAILRNKDLSLKAKGLYGFMYSMADGWNFTASSMASQLKESRKSILLIMKELKEFGLIEYEKLKSGKGIYTIYSDINPVNKPKSRNDTLPENSQSPETTPCQNDTVSKEDCIKNKDTIKNQDFINNPIEGSDCKSSKSKGKSKKQKLNLTEEELAYRVKLFKSSYVGRLCKVYVEQKEEYVFIDEERKIYTESRTNKQILSSTLSEIYKQLHIQNESQKRVKEKLKG